MTSTLNNPGPFRGRFRRTPELDKVVNAHESTANPITAQAYSQGIVTIWVYPADYVLRKQRQSARYNA